MGDGMADPVGRPQGGMKSEKGRGAYWRMQYESAIGALADLIAEHSETVVAVESLADDWEADGNSVSDLNQCAVDLRAALHPKENADDRP